jgi:hypothetical protein
VYFDFLCNFEQFFIPRRIERRSKSYVVVHVKYLLVLGCFMKITNFLDSVLKNPQTSNFMKIHQVGAESFRADGRTW